MRARRSLPSTSAIANHGVPSCVPCAEHAHDGRMLEARQRRDLAGEAGDDVGVVGQRRRQELERDRGAAVDRGRAVDGSHAAAAQARVDAVAADVGSGAVDLGHEARAARDRAGARDVDLRRAGRAGDHRVCVRGKRRVASGAEQVQRGAPFYSRRKGCLRLPAPRARRGAPTRPENPLNDAGLRRDLTDGTAVAKRAGPCPRSSRSWSSLSSVPRPRRLPSSSSSLLVRVLAARTRPRSSSTRAPTRCTCAATARSSARSPSRSGCAASASSARATTARRSAATGWARRARRSTSTSSCPSQYPTPAQARMGFTGGAIGIHGPPRGW